MTRAYRPHHRTTLADWVSAYRFTAREGAPVLLAFAGVAVAGFWSLIA